MSKTKLQNVCEREREINRDTQRKRKREVKEIDIWIEKEIKRERENGKEREGDNVGQWLWLSWYSSCFLYQRYAVQIQSSAKIYLYSTFVYCQLCIEKTKIKKKRPGWPYFFNSDNVCVLWGKRGNKVKKFAPVPSSISSCQHEIRQTVHLGEKESFC